MIRTKLIGFMLGGLMLLAGAGVASAASVPWGRDCAQRIEHRRFELNRAVERHGYRSWQAENARRDLARAEYECR